MKLEDQVVSLRLAKKLKKLGFKQKSYFMWCDNGAYIDIWNPTDRDEYDTGRMTVVCSTYTVAELGVMLEAGLIGSWKSVVNNWCCKYEILGATNTTREVTGAKTEADARAKMLIYLKENNLI